MILNDRVQDKMYCFDKWVLDIYFLSDNVRCLTAISIPVSFMNHKSISWSHQPKISKTSIFHKLFFPKDGNFKIVSTDNICLRVRLNVLGFQIHDRVLNFHNWIPCYHEPFYKIKRYKSIKLLMDLWHLSNMIVISIL